jgi:hypothetical protein
MRVLVACEESQAVTIAFREKGHEAYSCDIQECSGGHPEWHIQGDAIKEAYSGKYDMMIAHPPCTYLSVSGLHWNKRNPERADKTEEALRFVQQLMDAPIDKIAVENPISCISSRIRKPEQILQPYQFGEDASKKTCLWLKNLKPLVSTKYIEPRIVDGRLRWSNQTDSGQNKLGPSPDRAKLRSKTYKGIAKAMADQWGVL